MAKFGSLRKTLLVGAALALPSIMSASAIGTLDIAGTDLVRAASGIIDFFPMGTGFGGIAKVGSVGDFNSTPNGTLGLIKDLFDPPSTAGPNLASPITNFVTIGTFDFTLNRIFLGFGPPCTIPPPVGGSCSLTELNPNTPFLLTQNTSSVSVSFAVQGVVHDSRDNSFANYNGLFTANLTEASNNTIAGVINSLTVSPGFVQSSWAAEFTSTAAPEPIEMSMIGGGLILLVALGRRLRSRV